MGFSQHDTVAIDVPAIVKKVGVGIERAGQAGRIRAPDISQGVHIEIGYPGSAPCGEQGPFGISQVRKVIREFEHRRVRDQAFQLSECALLKAGQQLRSRLTCRRRSGDGRRQRDGRERQGRRGLRRFEMG